MKYYFLVLSAVLVAIASCKKVEIPDSNEEILRKGKWKMELDTRHGILKNKVLGTVKPVDTFYVLEEKDGSGNLYQNRFLDDSTYLIYAYPECKLDDYLEFRENGEGAHNTGANKCPNGETQEAILRYGFMNNYTRMFIYDAGDLFLGNDDVEGEVTEFSTERFTLKYRVIDNSKIPAKDTTYYTVTFKKI